MLIFNCTKAAADFFSTTRKGKKTSPLEPAPRQSLADVMTETSDPLAWQWLLHVIKVKGKNVLVAMDCQTRFSISLSALKKGDDKAFLNNLEHHLTVHIYEMMTDINADPQVIDASVERFRQQHNNCRFYLRGDRSVQAHINDVLWHFRSWVDNHGELPTDVDLIGLDVFANQLYRKRRDEKEYFTPQHEFFRAWLIHYGEYSPSQADAAIDCIKAKERADFDARHPELVLAREETAALPAKPRLVQTNNVFLLDD